MKRMLTGLTTLAIALVAFGATAVAASEVTPDDGTLLDLARPVFDAVVRGNWWLAAALAVVLLTGAAKRYLPDAYGGRLVRSELGGMVTAFMLAFGGALATTFAAPGAAMTMAVMLAALKVGFFAVGGWMMIHKIATVLVGTKFWNEKMPSLVKHLVTAALNLIGSSAIKKAEKSGQDAVDASPPTGADGAAGKPTEL